LIMPLFILGVKIDNLSKELVWQKISEILKSPENKGLQLVTVNPEFVLAAQKDANFLRIINHAWLAVPDGYGLRLAAKYLDLVSRVSFPPRVVARGKLWREFNFGRLLLITYYLLLGLKIAWWGMLRNDKKLDIIKETITGTDLIPEICKILSVIPDNSNVIPAQAGIQEYPLLKKEGRGEVNSPIGESRSVPVKTGIRSGMTNKKIFLLGGFGETPRLVKEKLLKDVIPSSEGAMESLEIDYSVFEAENVIEKINNFAPAVLFVALNHPRAQKWIEENLPQMPSVKLAMGVGGAFDYLSGKIKRAPTKWQGSFEWLYRLLHQPKRLRRIWQASIVFSWKVFKDSKFIRQTKN